MFKAFFLSCSEWPHKPPRLKILTKLFFFIGAMLALWACKKDYQTYVSSSKQSESDSISVWIKASRDKSLPLKARKDLLQKAEVIANLMPNDSNKLRHMGRIQWTYLDLNDSLAFRRNNSITQKLAIELKDSIRLANCYWDLGHFLKTHPLAILKIVRIIILQMHKKYLKLSRPVN